MSQNSAAACAEKPLILVAEDEADNQTVVSRLFQEAGYRVKVLSSGREALAQIEDPEIALVVTDLWMPGGNGIQFIEQVIKRRPTVEVIVFTGHATEATRAKAKEFGCFDVVSKPDINALLAATRSAVGGNRLARIGGAAASGEAAQAELGRVLLVDDQPTYTRVIRNFLEQRGYSVRVEKDGVEALACFQRDKFDLVLMDINMPRMDGIEALRGLRAQDPDVSVVVVSGEAGGREIVDAHTAGATAILSKPVKLEKLAAKVREYIALTRRLRREARQARRRAQYHASRSAAQKAVRWLRSPRTAPQRRRLAMRALGFLLVALAGLGATAIADWSMNAGRLTTGLIGRLTRVFDSLDRVEGYLERDEQRELKQNGETTQPEE